MNTVPRIMHNIGLWAEFAKAHPPKPTVGPVGDQRTSRWINPRKLFPFGYNPSIIQYGARTLMAYRYHPVQSWETKLAIAELDHQFNVISNREITLTGPSNEDPRLFEVGGVLFICYVHSRLQATAAIPICAVRYGKLIEEEKAWIVEGQTLVNYEKNGESGLQKNWVPFMHAGKLHFIYDTETVIEVDGAAVTQIHKSVPKRWKWGKIRGGTSPIEHDGKWLRFFHSRLDNEPKPNGFRYYIGALLMENKPPFEVIQVSKRPILIGSEIDAITVTEKSNCHQWKPNCVLPYGVIQRGDSFDVSVGVNDSSCVISNINPKDFNL